MFGRRPLLRNQRTPSAGYRQRDWHWDNRFGTVALAIPKPRLCQASRRLLVNLTRSYVLRHLRVLGVGEDSVAPTWLSAGRAQA
jgi:hypothetical protein